MQYVAGELLKLSCVALEKKLSGRWRSCLDGEGGAEAGLCELEEPEPRISERAGEALG